MIFKFLTLILLSYQAMAIPVQTPDIPETQASSLGFRIQGSIAVGSSGGVVLLQFDSNYMNAFKAGDTFQTEKTGKAKGITILKVELVQKSNNEAVRLKVQKPGGQQVYVFKDNYFNTNRPQPKKPTAPVAVKKPTYSGEHSEEGFSRKDNSIEMSAEFRDNMVKKDLSKILMQASTTKIKDPNGQVKGFMIDDIEANSIYTKAGLQNGDIITAIGEWPQGAAEPDMKQLGDAASAVAALRSLQKANRVLVHLERNGQAQEVTIDVR